MAKSKDGGIFKGLTRKEVDVLRSKLGAGAEAAIAAHNDNEFWHEVHGFSPDLHDAWMADLARKCPPGPPRSLKD